LKRLENLDELRSHSSAAAATLISQMKITSTRGRVATGLVNPSAMRTVSARKKTVPAIGAQFLPALRSSRTVTATRSTDVTRRNGLNRGR
jgi:hypothetical protein